METTEEADGRVQMCDGTTDTGPENGFEKLFGVTLSGVSRKDEYLKDEFIWVRPIETDLE